MKKYFYFLNYFLNIFNVLIHGLPSFSPSIYQIMQNRKSTEKNPLIWIQINSPKKEDIIFVCVSTLINSSHFAEISMGLYREFVVTCG